MQRVCLRSIRRPPHRLHDHSIGEHLVRMRREQFHQVPLRGSNVNDDAAGAEAPLFQIDLQFAEPDDRFSSRGWTRSMSECHSYPRKQLVYSEWFGKVIVGTEV